MSWTTPVSQYQKGKTNLDFTEARDTEWQWQWHKLGHMQVCILLRPRPNWGSLQSSSRRPIVFMGPKRTEGGEMKRTAGEGEKERGTERTGEGRGGQGRGGK